jgi:hypothetical protein
VVQQIIQVANEDCMGSLTAVCRLDREVQELSTIHPSGDLIEHMERVQVYDYILYFFNIINIVLTL